MVVSPPLYIVPRYTGKLLEDNWQNNVLLMLLCCECGRIFAVKNAQHQAFLVVVSMYIHRVLCCAAVQLNQVMCHVGAGRMSCVNLPGHCFVVEYALFSICVCIQGGIARRPVGYTNTACYDSCTYYTCVNVRQNSTHIACLYLLQSEKQW